MEFFILNNSGDVVYPDTDKMQLSEWELRVQREISDLNRKGFYFYYHPAAGRIVTFFKGSRGTRNQFYGVLNTGEPTEGLLPELKARIEETFEDQGWTTAQTGSSGDTIYTNLTNAEPLDELEINRDHLQHLQNDSQENVPIELGAPDYLSALQVSLSLVELLGPDTRISICTSGIVEGLLPSDVVVVPNDSEYPGEAVRGSLGTVNELKLQESIQNAQENIQQLQADDPGMVADALNQTNIQEYGIFFDTSERRKKRRTQVFARSMFTGGLLGLVASIAAGIFLGIHQEILVTFNRIVHLQQIPLIEIEQLPQRVPVTSWYIVAGSLTIITVSTLNRNRIWGLVAPVYNFWKQLWKYIAGSANVKTGDSIYIEDLVDELDRIKNNPAVENNPYNGFANVVRGRIFANTILEVHEPSDIRRDHRITAFKGFSVTLLFILVGAALVGVAALSIGRVWIIILNGLVALALLVVGWKVGSLLIRFGRILVTALDNTGFPSIPSLGRKAKEQNNLDVLILGPQSIPATGTETTEIRERNRTKNIINMLYQASLHEDKIDEVDPNEHLQSIVSNPKYDFAEEFKSSKIIDISFEFTLNNGTNGNVLFPHTQDEYLNSDLDEYMQDQKGGLTTQDGGNSPKIESIIARGIVDADVIVLTFPVNRLALTTSKEIGDKDMQSSEKKIDWYIHQYEDLIYNHLTGTESDKCILGIATEMYEWTTSRYNINDIINNPMAVSKIRQETTEYACSAEIRDKLDNGVDNELLFAIWVPSEEEEWLILGCNMILRKIFNFQSE